MARNLDIDFSIICGKLEKYREDILGSLIINVSSEHKEKVKRRLLFLSEELKNRAESHDNSKLKEPEIKYLIEMDKELRYN